MSEKKTWQVQCGAVRGIAYATTASRAFRKVHYGGKHRRADWGMLARFREITLGHGDRIFKESVWLYQDPTALFKDQP